MEHTIKQFTVVDLLGFLLPGAVFVLAYHYFIGGVTEPFLLFFGKKTALLSVYFLVLSYITGILLHEFSGLLGRCMGKRWLRCNSWDEAMRKKYQQVFHKEPPTNPAEQRRAEEEIYRYIQVMSNEQKLRLFSAFSSMSRTMLGTMLLILVLVFCKSRDDFHNMLGPVLFICAILFSNWRHYQLVRAGYIYILFRTIPDDSTSA